MLSIRLIVLLLSACLMAPPAWAANQPHHQFADGKIPQFTAGAKILLLPLNPNQLLKENEIQEIESEIVQQLTDAGATPKKGNIILQEERFNYMLFTSAAAFGVPEAKLAKEQYVQAIGASYELVVMPVVYETLGNMAGEYLYFEGAKTKVRMTGGRGHWSGQQRGLVLRYDIFTGSGEWLMSVSGGIAMPREANYKTNEFTRKDYLFEDSRDRKYLTKGVKIVMKPIIKKLKFK